MRDEEFGCSPERIAACLSSVDQVIKWVPIAKKPVVTLAWFEALEEAGLMGGRVVLTWEVDAWRVTSAIAIYGMSPSGTLGKPMDARDELIRSLQSKGLPVKV